MKGKSTVQPTPRESSRLLLSGGLDRRTFVTRLAQLGVALPAATALMKSLSAQPGAVARSRALGRMTGGEVMAEFLRDWDVDHIFGLGGSEEVGFLDALVDRTDLRYVLALHEGSAVSMADGFARVSRKPGFLNLHSVAGAGNALGPMVNAFKDRTPLVVTVGRQSTRVRGSQAFLEAPNLHLLPRDYTRWTWDIARADTIPEMLRRAFLLARVPPRGPTFVTFSKDLWEVAVEGASIIPPGRSPVESLLAPDQDLVRRACDRLLGAEAPLLLAGREIALYGGLAEMVEVAELLGATVVSDVPASHSPIGFPTQHPLYGGLFTMESNLPHYDLFWSVGGTMFTLFSQPPGPLVDPSTRIVHSSIEAGQIGSNYPVDTALTGHPVSVLRAVAEELKKRGPDGLLVSARRQRAEAFHAARTQRLRDEAAAHWEGSPIPPERLMVELNRRLAPDATVVSELATSDFFLWKYLDFNQNERGRRHITSSGGWLGWGPGAAIGAKIGASDRQTALLVGDGSFQFGVQALWTASRYDVPVAFIIFNNRAYQANRRALHNYGGRAAETGKYIGCYLGSPDIDHVRLASAYGIEGEKVQDTASLGAAIDRCLRTVNRGRPFVLDVIIEPRFAGADSTWIDFFSVAAGTGRSS